ncbi:MAG: DUF433 domain-containing protein [Pseudomonadota bacterium]
MDPAVRFGKPCISGTRITVSDLLSAFAAGDTLVEILDDYPYLTEESVRAAFAYAATSHDHPVVMAAE